jgi:hypothetical protein
MALRLAKRLGTGDRRVFYRCISTHPSLLDFVSLAKQNTRKTAPLTSDKVAHKM